MAVVCLTGEQAVSLVGLLTASYPNARIQDANIEAYAVWIVDLPFQATYEAINLIIANSAFFPSIAEIREKTLQRMPESHIPSPVEAWEEVVRGLKNSSPQKQPTWSHPLISRVIRMLDWYLLASSTNITGYQHSFFTIYKELYAEEWGRVRATKQQAAIGSKNQAMLGG